jgi:hypothetical protein
LQAQFGGYDYQLQAVQFWITEIRRGRQDLHDEICSGRPLLGDLNGKILAILDKSLFESAHSMTERLIVAYSTVLQHLHESFWFKSFHLHWVPHQLTVIEEKTKGVCKGYVSILACCQTGRLASSCD